MESCGRISTDYPELERGSADEEPDISRAVICAEYYLLYVTLNECAEGM